MRNRTVAALLVVPALAAALTGCGSDSNDGLRGETIHVMAFWSGAEQEAFTKVYELFERNTGVDVQYVPAGDELATLLQTSIQGGNPPNVAIVPQHGLMRELADDGRLTPLADDVVSEVRSNYVELYQDLGQVDGRLYGVFFKITNKSTVWYRPEVLTRYNLGPPSNWQDFVKLCNALADLGVTPLSVGGADGWVLTDWFENVYLQRWGPERYDMLSKHQIPWTHHSVRKVFEILGQVLGQDRLLGGRAEALRTEYQASVVNVFGPQADRAMVYEGDFVAAVIQDETDAVVGEDAEFFPFPFIPGEENDLPEERVVVGGDVAVALKNDRPTMEFMRFLASRDAGAMWAGIGGFLSPNKNVPVDAYPDETTKSLADRMHKADENVRFDMSDLYPAKFGATKGAGQWKAMQDFLDNPQDIDAVLAQLERAAND